MTCGMCGAPIDLRTPVNAVLIKETAEACARIGIALTKVLEPKLETD
jgi:hypothetical protein